MRGSAVLRWDRSSSKACLLIEQVRLCLKKRTVRPPDSSSARSSSSMLFNSTKLSNTTLHPLFNSLSHFHLRSQTFASGDAGGTQNRAGALFTFDPEAHRER